MSTDREGCKNCGKELKGKVTVPPRKYCNMKCMREYQQKPKEHFDGTVTLAEEGTLMAEFQRDRTDAISAMFDRDKMCGTLHTTSQFFADLDNSVQRLLKEERQRTLKGVREKLPDTKWHKQPGFILKQTTEYEEGYNTAIIDFDAALSELEGEITGNEKEV